jgi:epsilon-lactone hydrolase
VNETLADDPSSNSIAIHPLDSQDAKIIDAMRALTRSSKGVPRGIEARGPFDAVMGSVSSRENVTFEAGTVGGIPGVWVLPSDWRPDEAVLHLHGGWFNFGTAMAYRHLVGHVAARAEARAFIPDYRLAPEYPFPAAVEDVLVCYKGFSAQGIRQIVLTGDSAGGNLALVLASRVAAEPFAAGTCLAGVAVLSPVTDLTLSGSTYETRAEADPLFTRSQVADLVHSYLRNADPTHPYASPLYAPLSGLAPIRIQVGDDEVLLDDSRRYIKRATAAGVDAKLDVWMGMPHGFHGSIGKLLAAEQAFDALGVFLAERLRVEAAGETTP